MSLMRLWPLCLLAIAAVGCEDPFPSPAEVDAIRSLSGRNSSPHPDETNRLLTQPAAVTLGTGLFHDPTLSACGTVSCASCHQAEHGYAFPEAAAPGCGGNTDRNPPSILNVGYTDWFMWDGRADRGWSQAVLPLLNPVEMASTPALLRERLLATPAYVTDYTALFGESPEVSSDNALLANFGKAIQAYEWTLNRMDAPFDDQLAEYLQLAEEGGGAQQEHPLHLGLKTFVRKGQCLACHKGPALTDSAFHNPGLQDPSAGRSGRLAGVEQLLASVFRADGEFSDSPNWTRSGPAARTHNLASEDPALVSGREGAFKTPTLRNVALTAPYMHTGSLATLADVVEFYNRGGDPADTFAGVRADTILPLNLTDEEKAALVSLLESLTGTEE